MRSPIDFSSATRPTDVQDWIERLYQRSYLPNGVVHVTSVWRRDPSTHLTLRIGPHAPPSEVDLFILGLARARADAIVTTGRILRQEPELSHEIVGPGPTARALEDWRKEVLGKTKPPISLILTSGRDLDFRHPLFRGPGRQVILTDRKGAWSLESRASDAGVEIIAVDEPTPRDILSVLQGQFGCATISIEAGPTVSRQYYEPPMEIDELMLSVYCGDHLPPGARGLRQIPPDRLEALFKRPSPPFVVSDSDGKPLWEFHRWLRR